MKKLFLSLLGVMAIGSTALAAEQTYKLAFDAKPEGCNQDLGVVNVSQDNVDWTFTSTTVGTNKDDSTKPYWYYGYDSNNNPSKGFQIGSGGASCPTLNITTNGFEGKKVTSIAVETSGAKDTKATLGVKVNSVAYKSGEAESVNLTKDNAVYTFTGDQVGGAISIDYAQTSTKAYYIKSITVTYEDAPASQYTYELDPKSGETVSDLSAIKVKFPGVDFVQTTVNGKEVVLTNTTTKKKYKTVMADGKADGWYELTFSVDGKETVVNEAGEYELVIPAGFFELGGRDIWDITDGDSPEIKANYTIEAAQTAVDFASHIIEMMPNNEDEPAGEYWVGGVQCIIMLDTDVEINKESAGVVSFTRNGEAYGNQIDANSPYIQVADMGMMDVNAEKQFGIMMMFKEMEGKCEDGTYKMSIPEGFFVSGGAPMSAYEYTWQVGEKIPELIEFSEVIGAVIPNAEEEGMTPNDLWEDGVMVLLNTTQVIAKNNNFAGVITLTHDGAPYGESLSISSPYVTFGNGAEPMAEGEGETVEQGTALTLVFTVEGKAPAGEYTLNIPEGAFTVNNIPLSAYTTKFTVKKEITGDYGLTPENGEVVAKAVDDLWIEFPAASNVEMSGTATVKGPEGADVPNIFWMPEGNKLNGMVIGILGEGEWTITIPANSIKLDGVAYDKEINWNFKVELPKAEIPTLNPAAGSVKADELRTVILTAKDGVVLATGEDDTYYTVLSGPGFPIMYKAEKGDAANQIKLVLTPGAEIEPGEYTLQVGAGTYTIDGVANVAFEVKYTVIDENAPVYLPTATADPASGDVEAAALKTITLTLADGVKATKVDDTVTLKLVDTAVNHEEAVAEYTAAINENGNVVLTMKGETEIAAGSYSLLIPEGFYAAEEAINAPFQLLYTVKTASVDGIAVDEASEYNVYTVQGICVIRNGSREDLQLLPAGLYIVNGKKLIIRK